MITYILVRFENEQIHYSKFSRLSDASNMMREQVTTHVCIDPMSATISGNVYWKIIRISSTPDQKISVGRKPTGKIPLPAWDEKESGKNSKKLIKDLFRENDVSDSKDSDEGLPDSDEKSTDSDEESTDSDEKSGDLNHSESDSDDTNTGENTDIDSEISDKDEKEDLILSKPRPQKNSERVDLRKKVSFETIKPNESEKLSLRFDRDEKIFRIINSKMSVIVSQNLNMTGTTYHFRCPKENGEGECDPELSGFMAVLCLIKHQQKEDFDLKYQDITSQRFSRVELAKFIFDTTRDIPNINPELNLIDLNTIYIVSEDSFNFETVTSILRGEKIVLNGKNSDREFFTIPHIFLAKLNDIWFWFETTIVNDRCSILVNDPCHISHKDIIKYLEDFVSSTMPWIAAGVGK